MPAQPTLPVARLPLDYRMSRAFPDDAHVAASETLDSPQYRRLLRAAIEKLNERFPSLAPVEFGLAGAGAAPQ